MEKLIKRKLASEDLELIIAEEMDQLDLLKEKVYGKEPTDFILIGHPYET
jgi:hypothetical protein